MVKPKKGSGREIVMVSGERGLVNDGVRRGGQEEEVGRRGDEKAAIYRQTSFRLQCKKNI